MDSEGNMERLNMAAADHSHVQLTFEQELYMEVRTPNWDQQKKIYPEKVLLTSLFYIESRMTLWAK